MFRSSYVVVPKRGSEFELFSSSFRSSEYHRSLTVLKSRSLPIAPAGIVTVTLDPLAKTPLTYVGGRSSVTCSSPDLLRCIVRSPGLEVPVEDELHELVADWCARAMIV